VDPGKRDAPSLSVSATSVDARALVSSKTRFGTLSLDAGFRIDNSANVVDDPAALSIEHRVSLGVSSYHAVLAGAQLAVPTGRRAYVALESSGELFVGKGAPGPLLRAGGVVGIAVGDAFTATGYIELARVPKLDPAEVMAGRVVLIPYEPTVTAGLGLQARFGGARRGPPPMSDGEGRGPSRPVIETADVSGTVLDDAGKPIAGARVEIRLRNVTGAAVTDDRGGYAVVRLPIGRTAEGRTVLDDTIAEITAEVAHRKPGSTSLTLQRGANAAPALTLDPLLPPGQLRVRIINVGTSRPVAGATLTLDPGGVTATTGPDGKLTINVAPGLYQLTVTAKGLASQKLEVTIDENGVAIKNIELHR
jgi:carboxypeptidase family protein